MPWAHCDQEVSDTDACPVCGISKESWTIEFNATRTFVVSSGTSRRAKEAWVEIVVEDASGQPCANQAFELELPDGQVASGTLDAEGKTRHEGLYPGECLLQLEGVRLHQPTTAEPERAGLEDGCHVCATDRRHTFRRVPAWDLSWSEPSARRGEELTLSASADPSLEGQELELLIFEFDRDGAHDPIATLKAAVSGGQLSATWSFEYHEDSDEAPSEEELEDYGDDYNPPEYFFTVRAHEAEVGGAQESGLLRFRDWIEVRVTNGLETPLSGEPCLVYLPDGNVVQGETDESGTLRCEDVPPGRVVVELPALLEVYPVVDGEPVGMPAPAPDELQPDLDDEAGWEGFEADEDDDEDDDVEPWSAEEIAELDELEVDEDDEGEPALDEPHEAGFAAGPTPEPDLPPAALALEDEDEHADEEAEAFAVASRSCVTGRDHHLAVLHYCRVRVLDAQGCALAEPVDVEIRGEDGATLCTGRAGASVFTHAPVPMGRYQALIGDRQFWFDSVPDPQDAEFLILEANHGQG